MEDHERLHLIEEVGSLALSYFSTGLKKGVRTKTLEDGFVHFLEKWYESGLSADAFLWTLQKPKLRGD